MNSTQEQHLINALEISRQKEDIVAGSRMAAIIAKRKNVMAIGTNRYKSHPLQAKFSPNRKAINLHAETDAIRDFLSRYPKDLLSKCTLYIARSKIDGSAGLAKPCEGCQGAIVEFDFLDVFWTVDSE